jgi:hypothetical protein
MSTAAADGSTAAAVVAAPVLVRLVVLPPPMALPHCAVNFVCACIWAVTETLSINQGPLIMAAGMLQIADADEQQKHSVCLCNVSTASALSAQLLLL